ncbi:TRAF3-interacting protein 1 [Phlyctochytrium planicorne]|nr:TRAF3-interacting protein 1 [Phlyctochytrium planicorne]
MSQIKPSPPSAEVPAAAALDDSVKKTIDIMGRIIKKPPLTAKLLSKPPFRYLHDMFTEIIKSTAFAAGLYDDNEMNSENVKEKDAKVAYLLKMIDCVGISTGVEVKANPLKIVAGMDVEETNAFLQLLGKAILKKVDTSEVVKRVRAGEHQKKGGASPAKNPPAQAAPQAPPKQPATTTSPSQNAKPAQQQQQLQQPQQQPKISTQSAESKALPPKASTLQSAQVSDSSQQKQLSAKEHGVHEKRGNAISPTPPAKRQEESHLDTSGGDNVSSEDSINQGKHNERDERDNEDSTDDNQSSVKAALAPSAIKRGRERPSSARPPPPKVRGSEAAAEEIQILSPGIIQESSRVEDDEDESFVILGHEKENNIGNEEQTADENHGGLVRKILDIKGKLENKPQGDDSKAPEKIGKDKSSARREIEGLRESIQSLCRNTNPLSKTLDYLQEDVDAMNKELESWKNENKKHKLLLENELRETKEVIAPLEIRLKQVESGIEDLIDKISNSKAAIIQNDLTLQRLLRNITNPVK